MQNIIKRLIKDCFPTALIRWIRKGSHISFNGNFQSWHEAMKASSGYDNEIILEKTKAALLKVKSGEVPYERDSVLFDEIQYAWPLLAGLMWVAARCGGRLNVLDFGGSLGSTYFQNRIFLSYLPYVRWNIVEQSKYVKLGKEAFEGKTLRFYETIKDCLSENEPNIVILGGVLQYIENPFEVLDELLRSRCDHMIIDRTPFWYGSNDKLCVQTVPSKIYAASYPSWIFSKTHFRHYLNKKWSIIAEFQSFESLNAPVKASWLGFILARIKITN